MKWLECITESSKSKLRLICCPHSGGGASFYYPWAKLLPKEIELVAIQLPGRETRITEPLLKDMQKILNELIEEFKNFLDKPFILFGHSVGALICFELSKMLHRLLMPLPLYLMVSSCKAPHKPLRIKRLSQLPDEELISALKYYNGTPTELFEHKEILEVFLPIIRSDLSISENYKYSERSPLLCNILAISGDNDLTVHKEDIEAWRDYTFQKFKYQIFPGDHFYINLCRNDVLALIKGLIEAELKFL